MRRLLALVLTAGSLLVACPKSDTETTPCENHGHVQAITFSDPDTLSFAYDCQDGHSEFWEGGVKTEG